MLMQDTFHHVRFLVLHVSMLIFGSLVKTILFTWAQHFCHAVPKSGLPTTEYDFKNNQYMHFLKSSGGSHHKEH